MAPVSAAKWCIINTTIHYVPLLDLVPSQGRKQSTSEWVFWNNTQTVCPGEIWRGKLQLVFHPSVAKLAFEIDCLQWREPRYCHRWVDIRKSRIHRLSCSQEKRKQLILNRKEERYLMKARETSCLSPLTKKRQKEWVCEIMCRPKNNVSIAVLIVPLYPEWFLQSRKSCFRVKRENTIRRPASMKKYFFTTKEMWTMRRGVRIASPSSSCIQIRDLRSHWVQPWHFIDDRLKTVKRLAQGHAWNCIVFILWIANGRWRRAKEIMLQFTQRLPIRKMVIIMVPTFTYLATRITIKPRNIYIAYTMFPKARIIF